MGTRLPRLRQAWQSEYTQPGIEGPPRDFKGCVVINNPLLKVQLAFYDRDPNIYPEQAPMYERDMLIQSKKGVIFSTYWHDTLKMSENIAEKGKDVVDTWTLGLAGVRGLDFVLVKIMDA